MIHHVKSVLFGLGIVLLLSSGCNQKEKEHQAVISTEFGDITILLYNSTPKHRDNFIKLVNEGYYTDLLFHRIIRNFMIQGGDPQSKGAEPGRVLGGGGPGYTIDAEIGAPHIRGAVAAARTPNAAKASSGSQFYIVTGKEISPQELLQTELSKKIKYNDTQKKLYLEQGGYPSLDMEYTVFGEVVSGMDVVDKISMSEANERDRPLKDVKMSIKMIK
ncbi:MAG TPA: peptidylprolyl isomerase [Saprospiraceae bacterium]|jgi:cyclophilin family peptidyl-prolyl cis-trans isomerase